MTSAVTGGATILLAALGLAACGGDDGGPMVVEPGPAYLVGTRVWDDTTITSYFNVVSSIDADGAVDPGQAVEVPGSAKLYAVEGVGWFAIGGSEEPTITRYALGDDGVLAPRERISLGAYGVQALWDTLYVVSSTKMYYPDRDGRQLIVIDPSAMVVKGAIALPQTARDGFLSLYGYTPLVRGGKLMFSVGWFDWVTNDTVLGETGLVVLDTATDTVTRFDVDTRCGGITTAVATGSGDMYFVSSALAGAAFRLSRLTTAPCALRIQSGADAFDPTYKAQLADLTSGSISGEPIPAGGNAVFLRVFDESVGTVKADDQTWNLTGQAAWQWWRWDVASGNAARMTELPSSTADVLWFQVEGRVFGTETTTDYSQTTLIELTAAGGPKRALNTPGFLHGVARIR